jgi:hypothetical protein
VTGYRLALVLSGALAVVVIAAATVMTHRAMVPAPAFAALLLGTYAVGLGLGRLVLGRGG